MERVRYNGTIKPNLATNSAARSFIVSVDPNNNNAVSWDRGYHFNDVNTVAPVHSNGLTSNKTTYAMIYGITNISDWDAKRSNSWTIYNIAYATIDPYSFHGSEYEPVKSVDLKIVPGSSYSVIFNGPGYAGPTIDSLRIYFLDYAGGASGASWSQRAFTSIPYYDSNLLKPGSSTLYSEDVSPVIPKSQSLYMSSLSFPSSFTVSPTTTWTVGSYGVATGYTAYNVSLSPFRMHFIVPNKQGTEWLHGYIPLRVNSGENMTFKKRNTGRFELDSSVSFNARLDRECLRIFQNYLKACINAGTLADDERLYYCLLEWERGWRFSSLSEGGTGDASLSSNGHTSKFRVTWSVYNSNKYKVSDIEQIQ
jgi:hypothetical protein